MDPAAIRELQRLYNKKYKQTESRTKRRRLSDDVESQHSVEQVVDDASFAEFPGESEQSDEVETIAFDERQVSESGASAKEGYRAFMTGKIPRDATTSSKTSKSAEDSEDNLKNDKDLQRLLRDSHLLAEQGGTSLETSGKIRQKAISQQLISNGASAPKAQKMPLSMRKGIEAAAKNREAAREKYTRESGIVTARPTNTKVAKKRNKTLHELNVGSYKKGQLRVTRAEINRINGPAPRKGKQRSFRTFSNIG